MSSPIILWFRQDLRLNDNPALSAAIATGAPIIALYIHDPDAPWAPGAASRWWLHHALEVLAKSLKAKGVALVLRSGDPQTIIDDIIKRTDARSVYWNRLYEPHAVARDAQIKTLLKENGIDVQSFKASVLFEPWEIKTGGGTPFRVFTPYYRACLNQQSLIGACLKTPKTINGFSGSLSSDDLNLLPAIRWDKSLADAWTSGEEAAGARAHDFIEAIMPGYKTARDRPDEDGTSRLSPHLHFGSISPRMLWHAASPHTGSEAFLRELIWREFSVHLLFHNPSMPEKPLQEKFTRFPWQKNKKYLDAWQRGQTGYPIVDAGMRQLWQTGWMHNRVRMITGSFLVKHLLQPWQDGQAWFWDCLVDADLANNAAGWQWIGGCGADAAPYFRVFNPIIQGEKFDPKGEYVRRFVPELRGVPDKFIHKPWESGLKLDYPAPIIDHASGRTRALEAFAKLKNNKI